MDRASIPFKCAYCNETFTRPSLEPQPGDSYWQHVMSQHVDELEDMDFVDELEYESDDDAQ